MESGLATRVAVHPIDLQRLTPILGAARVDELLEAAASLGISLNHFERKVQPELKVVISGQLVLIPVAELERWVQRHAHQLMEVPSRSAREGRGDVSA